MTSRRSVLRGVGAWIGTGIVAGTSGCTGPQDGRSGTTSRGAETPDPADVVAGPDYSLRYRPETLTVAVDETVTWRFASENHNVSCVPDHHPKVVLPEGAEPFASYEDDDKYAVDPVGSTYEHTFSTPGRYVYVCIPHASANMIGTIQVKD